MNLTSRKPNDINYDRFKKFNTSGKISDSSHNDVTHTVQSIEDATDRLSNLVRLMDENSKIMQPSDLTI